MSNNSKYLLDMLTKNLILMVMEEFGVSIQEAMAMVYNSQLYESILDLDTGLYYQSAGYNYQLLHKELTEGKIA